ncbi:MAG: T9SS type A sorting domain-containing protein [Bacteroidales bacterium]|jgi:hypothetical protein|nr:T9SS type A sorting domain-containing protein [Bacteroidales bacterium]
MKRILLLICGLVLCFSGFAQEPEEPEEVVPRIVDSVAHNRKVIIEQYTGINSPFCPAAHKLSATYAAAHPDSVFIINVHTGGYAPKYRTADGDTLAKRAGFSYYPSASINHTLFDTNTVTAVQDTGLWKTYGNAILSMPSFVNVAASATMSYYTKQVDLHVEVFYTATAEMDSNSVHVVLVQDDILGQQKGKENNPSQIVNGQYLHKFMFRDYLYSQKILVMDSTEEPPHLIAPIDSGTFFQWDTTYIMPDSIGPNGDKVATELGKMSFIVYVAQDASKTIYTATKVQPVIIELPDQITFGNLGITLEQVLGCNNKVVPSVKLKNESDSTITSFQIECSGSARKYWSGTLLPFENLTIVFDTIEVTIGTETAISVSIDTVNGIGLDGGIPYFLNVVTVNKQAPPEGKGQPVLLLQCDRWGSETTWNLYNVETNQIIQSGGPYPNYNPAPTKPDTIVLTSVNTAGCYIFEIKDAYGDGINNGNGAGFYRIIDGETTVLISSNGKFDSGEKKDFQITTMVGIEDIEGSICRTTLYPNPAKNLTTLTISSPQATVAQITVTDMLGRERGNLGNKVLKPGNNDIKISTVALENGIYFINVVTEYGTSTKKLAVKK